MTAIEETTHVEALIARGFTGHEAASRAQLFTLVAGGFRRESGREPHWAWWVPGRLEVFGKHTDYAGGRSLVAAMPRGFVVVAGPRTDRLVCVIDARLNTRVLIDPAADGGSTTGWAGYVAAVVRRLSQNFPGADLGCQVVVASDLPRAAGLSSSSALVIAAAMALVRRASLETRPEWRESIGSRLDLAAYLSCIESGQLFRELAGTNGVGTDGGSEDHTAILNCRAGVVSQFRFVPVQHDVDATVPPDWRFVVSTSGVHASKTGAVRDRYNRAARLARVLLDTWNASAPVSMRSLGAAMESSADAASQLRDRLRVLRSPKGDYDQLVARLDHFVGENARVVAACAAFDRADARTLAALACASQADAAQLLANQVPETMALVEASRALGALAACSFGAGFGGSAWALIGAADAERFGEAWTRTHRVRHAHLSPPEWFVARPSLPFVELTRSGAGD